MTIRFDDRVAIVTGAGQGLGRCHALELARRGARVVVNDLGGALDGTGGSLSAAEAVVAEIEGSGGQALTSGANVADYAQVEEMVAATLSRWGRVDILINNAGILRDKTFAKMPLDDFAAVMAVHVNGAVNCTKAVWQQMREQQYGRIVFTTSSSGLYGNFGQSNYGAAKMALVGLMNTLHLEGQKYNIKVNCLAPCAGTRMLAGLMPDEAMALLAPETVTPGVIVLVSEAAPERVILAAGGGAFARVRIYETEGLCLLPQELSAETVAARWQEISATAGQTEPASGGEQSIKFLEQAAALQGVTVPPRR